jgi:hemerythrin-like domain-containing protein
MSDDIVDRIEHDHREVEALFAQFDRAPNRGLALKICEELEVHTNAEEAAVYPVLEEELSSEADKVQEAENEHQEARELIEQIRSVEDLAELVELMGQLEAAISHHVDEEESEMLPKARRELPSRELDELGEKFEDAKAEAD